MTSNEAPIDYLSISMSLLDNAKAHGFYFRRVSPHPDAAIVGIRYRRSWTEVVRLDGWRSDCQAWKQPTKLVLAVPSDDAYDHASGSALNILNKVVCW